MLVGRNLLVDTGSTGLKVLDVANPASSFLLSSINPGGGGTGFSYSAADRFAYFANGSGQTLVIDLFQPGFPTLIETIPVPVDADDVAALGDRLLAVAAATGGIRIFRINPLSGSREIGHIDLGASVSTIANHGTLILATDSANDLHIINAANPEQPTEVGIIDLTAAPKEIKVVGNRLYIAEGTTGLVVMRLQRRWR